MSVLRARVTVADRRFKPDPYGVDVYARLKVEGLASGVDRLDLSFRISGEAPDGPGKLAEVLARLGVDP